MQGAPDIPWPQIDTVLFDMDGTLLDLRFDTAFWMDHLPAHVAERDAVDLSEAREQLLRIMRDRRDTLQFYCFDWWSDVLGFDIVALKRDLAHLIDYRPGAREFIGAVRASGRRAILVTNSHQAGMHLKHEITGVLDTLDAIECAHEVGEMKEDAAFWDRVHERHAFDPQRTLLIDDNHTVLQSAAAWGIAHLRAIHHPDSSRDPVSDAPFPAIVHFLDHLPEGHP